MQARSADGAHLEVSVYGDGPPLLLIPGLGSTRSVFDPIVPSLQRLRRVIVYDPRGVGDSDPGTRPFTMPLLAADAEAVLDATTAPQADVFGASMGGVVAQQLAVTSPQRVRHLILAATTPGGEHAVPADPRTCKPGSALQLAPTRYVPNFPKRSLSSRRPPSVL